MRLRPLPADSPDIAALQNEIVRTRASLAGLVALVDDDGTLLGPFSCLPYSPGVGEALQRVGTELRGNVQLSRSAVEAIILAVAVHWQADYEWYAHAAVARAEGILSEDDLELILSCKRGLADPAADFAAAMTRELLESKHVSAGTWTEARQLLTDRAAVELITLAGYYTTLAMLIRAFETPLPSSVDTPFGSAVERDSGAGA